MASLALAFHPEAEGTLRSYDLVLKDKGTPQENFDALEEQVNVIGKSHAKYIHAVCSVVSISSDHIAVSRTIQLLAKFLHHLYMLQDFWLLFRTADHSRLPEQPRHVKVFCIQPQDMMVFHEALQGNPQLKRLSFICESALDQPPMLIRLPQGQEPAKQPALFSVLIWIYRHQALRDASQPRNTLASCLHSGPRSH